MTSRTKTSQGNTYKEALNERKGPVFTETHFVKGEFLKVKNQISLSPGNLGWLTKKEAEVYTVIEKLIRDNTYSSEPIIFKASEILKILGWAKSGVYYKTIDTAIQKVMLFRQTHYFNYKKKDEDYKAEFNFALFPRFAKFKNIKDDTTNTYIIVPDPTYLKYVKATGKQTLNLEHYTRLKNTDAKAIYKWLSQFDKEDKHTNPGSPLIRDMNYIYEKVLGMHGNVKTITKTGIIKKALKELKAESLIKDSKTVKKYKFHIVFYSIAEKNDKTLKTILQSKNPGIVELESDFQEKLKEEATSERLAWGEILKENFKFKSDKPKTIITNPDITIIYKKTANELQKTKSTIDKLSGDAETKEIKRILPMLKNTIKELRLNIEIPNDWEKYDKNSFDLKSIQNRTKEILKSLK